MLAQTVKNPTCRAGDLGSIPGLGSSPEEGMTTHSSILPEAPWTNGPGCSPWGQKELDRTERLSTAQHTLFEVFCISIQIVKLFVLAL